MHKKAHVIHPSDNVAVAVAPLRAGETVEIGEGERNQQVEVSGDIPFGHKFALLDISPGDPVIKYGTSRRATTCTCTTLRA